MTPISTTCSPEMVFMYSVVRMPAIMPMYPNNVVIVMLSVIINPKIEIGLAPKALRMPNSRVRSFTVISMILLTPTIPLNKVKMPITQMEVRNRLLAVCCVRYWVKRFQTWIALRSSASNCLALPMASRYSCSKASLLDKSVNP